jgi:fucose permease
MFFTVFAALGQMTSVFYNIIFKKIQIILAGYILLIPMIIILNFYPRLLVFYIIYSASGYILGVIWMQANKFVLESSVRNKEKLITLFLTFYPIGAFAAPFVSSSIIKSGLSWNLIYYVIIFFIVANIILYIIVAARKKESTAVLEEAKLPLKEIFSDKVTNIIFAIVCLALIFYSCSETIVATWSPTFFILAGKLSPADASLALNLFWLFIILGRLFLTTVAGRIKSTSIMVALSIIAISSMCATVFVYNRLLIFVLISIAGLGYSMLFPLLISTGSTIYGKGRGVLATFLFISGSTGVALAPVLTKFSSGVSLAISLSFSFILMIFITIMILIIAFMFAKKNHKAFKY